MKPEEKKQTVHQIMIDVIDEICDKYCKYPDMMIGKSEEQEPDMLEDMLYEQYCANCPVNKLC